VVPTGTTEPLVGVTLKKTPLHLTVVVNEFITGFGSTVTVKLKEVPAQEPVKVVTEYTAVLACAVLLVNVPVILLPLPATPPVTLVDIAGIDQEYVVPEGIMPALGVTLKVAAVQIAVVKLVI
jgi:hypothetical protein